MINKNTKKTTEEILMESFKELALTEPIDKITIQEITDKAGVIRPTFYNHFEDKYDLLESIMRRELITPVMPMFEGGFFQEGLTILFKNALKNKAFYIRAARFDGPISFRSIIEEMIKEQLLQYISDSVDSEYVIQKWFTSSDVAEYYAQSMGFVAMKWLHTGMTMPPEAVAAMYITIISNSLEEMLMKFEPIKEYVTEKGYILL